MLAKMVGERPSFWQLDVVKWGNFGEVGCSSGGGLDPQTLP